MKRFAIIGGTMALMLMVVNSAVAAQAVFHVAPDGNDAHPGTAAEPLASLAGARDRVRALLAKGKQTGDIEVLFKQGDYLFEKTVEFGPEDSGRDGFRVIYRNADALGSARFLGAGRATGWQPHENGIWKKTGITEPVTTLVEDGVRARFARFPNHKPDPKYPGAMAPYVRTVSGSDTTAIYKEGDLDPAGWTVTEQAELAWWTPGDSPKRAFDWQLTYRRLGSVDAERRTLHLPTRTKNRFTRIAQDDRYFVQNIYELLDAPGEFFHDHEQEVVYYKPHRNDPNSADVRMGGVTTLILIEGTGPDANVHHITFSGLMISYGNYERFTGAMELSHAGDIRVEGCHFKHVGAVAVFGREGVHHCIIRDCWIEHCGESGVVIWNSPRSGQAKEPKRATHPTVRNEYNLITNCKMHDLAEVFLSSCLGGGAVLYTANDCVVSHCEIFNNYRYATSLRGHFSNQRDVADMGTHFSRGNLFEYIKAYRLGTDSGDMGAVHVAHVNEPSGDCINTWRQITVRDVVADPSMKDVPPAGIYADHPYSAQWQVWENFEIANSQDKKQFKNNNNPEQTFRNVSWKPGFDRSKMHYDRIGLTAEFPAEYGGKGVTDERAPTPNTSAWAEEPRASATKIVLRAKEASDDISGVQYFFDCLGSEEHDSGWIGLSEYTLRGLRPKTAYRFRVKTRDTSRRMNEGAWSDEVEVTTVDPATIPCRLHYRFEKDLRDAQGGHHGKGRATFAAQAREGSFSLQCNGGDPVQVPYNDALRIGPDNFGLALWFLQEATAKKELYLLHMKLGYSHKTLHKGEMRLSVDQDGVRFFAANKGCPALELEGKIDNSPGTWTHLALNVERNGKATLYLNGKAVDTVDSVDATAIAGGVPLSIGGRADKKKGSSWDGLIDDLRVYDRLITETEIAELAR